MSFVAHPTAVRLHWDATEGWVVDVPTAINQDQLQRIAQWALPRQIDRARSLPRGDRRRELEAAIVKLQQGEIRQRVETQRDGTVAAFQSTERTKPQHIFIPGT